jgi:hypothetical protein
MARSSYIYIVRDFNNGVIVAAFTVKHEMETFVANNPDEYTVYRCRDGVPYTVVIIDFPYDNRKKEQHE